MLELDETENTKKKKAICWQCGGEVKKQDYTNLTFIPKCPHCGASYPEKPILEAKLTIYQDEFLKNRTQSNFNRLFNPLYDLIFNIICSKLKKSVARIPRDSIEDMVQWTLMKVASYYREKPDFKVTGSFTSYLGQVVLYPLYNKVDRVREEKEISIYTQVNSTNEERAKTILDELSEETEDTFEINMLNKLSQDRVVENATKFIGKAFNILYWQHKNKNNTKAFSKVVELASLYRNYMNKKNERYYRELNKTCSPDLRENFFRSLSVLKDYLRTGAVNED